MEPQGKVQRTKARSGGGINVEGTRTKEASSKGDGQANLAVQEDLIGILTAGCDLPFATGTSKLEELVDGS